MKTFILMVVMLAAGSASAEDKPLCSNTVIQNCNPMTTTKVVYQTEAQKKRIKELEAENAALKAQLAKRSEVVDRVVIKREAKPNSVSILVPYSPTKLTVTQSSGQFSAKTDYRLDFGLAYQRDLSEEVRLTVGATIQGTALLGAGYNF